MNKLVGIISFDILMIFSPFMIEVAPEVVTWVGYILSTLLLLTIITVVSSKSDGDTLKVLELERRKKPDWYNYYDVVTDILFGITWVSHGFYTIVFLLILVKIVILIKIPNYYKGV